MTQTTKRSLGMVGLGRMGLPMSQRLQKAGIDVVGYDISAEASARARECGIEAAEQLPDLVEYLESPRVIWLMLPSGAPTSSIVNELANLLDPGDLIVDGGNSHFEDAPLHAEHLAEKQIRFVDVGVSGGIWGAERGYGLMVGADAQDYGRLIPALKALASADGHAHVGRVGTGHLSKAIHNGVQYAMMQAYSEAFELLNAAEGVDHSAVLSVWQSGCSVRSWILGHLAEAVKEDPMLTSTEGSVGHSGQGAWTVAHAAEAGVSIPCISSAVFARLAVANNGSDSARALAALRLSIGGHRRG